MSYFKRDDSEAVKVSGSTGYITKSGIYPVTLNAVIVDVNDHDARSLHLYVTREDQAQVLYNAIRLDNNDGTENYQSQLLHKLMTIADLTDLEEPIEATLPIGKKEAEKDVYVFEEFDGLDIQIHVQMEYSLYNGNIQERQVLRGIYREDGASADEILNDKEVGKRLEKDMKYADRVTYKNDLDEETVKAWIDGGRKDGGATGGGAAKADSKPRSKPKFGRKE